LVLKSDGLSRSRLLAKEYGQKALKAIVGLRDSKAKEALNEMVEIVLQRTK